MHMLFGEKWYTHHNKLVGFMSVLSEAGMFESQRELIRGFEKPWRFDAEYERWVKLGKPADVTIEELTDDGVEECLVDHDALGVRCPRREQISKGGTPMRATPETRTPVGGESRMAGSGADDEHHEAGAGEGTPPAGGSNEVEAR